MYTFPFIANAAGISRDPTLTNEDNICILSSQQPDDSDWGWEPTNPNPHPIESRLRVLASLCREFVDTPDHTEASDITYRCFYQGSLVGVVSRARDASQITAFQPLDVNYVGKLGPNKKQIRVLKVHTIECDWNNNKLVNEVMLSMFQQMLPAHYTPELKQVLDLPFILCRVPLIPSLLLFLVLHGFQPSLIHEDGELEVCSFDSSDLIGSIHQFLFEAVCQHSILSFGQKFLHHVKTYIDQIDVLAPGIHMLNVDKLVK